LTKRVEEYYYVFNETKKEYKLEEGVSMEQVKKYKIKLKGTKRVKKTLKKMQKDASQLSETMERLDKVVNDKSVTGGFATDKTKATANEVVRFLEMKDLTVDEALQSLKISQYLILSTQKLKPNP